MQHYLILRVISKFLIPPIMLFAIYVQMHGDYGPGGGFQAGIIVAITLILYALVFGTEALLTAIPAQTIRAFAACGLLLYAGTGVVSLLLDKNYLDYSALYPDPVEAQHLGILLVELGVGLTVAFSMLAIFVAFTSHAPEDEEL